MDLSFQVAGGYVLHMRQRDPILAMLISVAGVAALFMIIGVLIVILGTSGGWGLVGVGLAILVLAPAPIALFMSSGVGMRQGRDPERRNSIFGFADWMLTTPKNRADRGDGQRSADQRRRSTDR